jgi:putative Flp pilus-assembly TadE/G-like protein
MAYLRKRGRLGQAVVLVAVSAMVLAGILMLALDGGLLYLDRRQLQSAADAAALAGAEFLWQSYPQSYTLSHQQAMTVLTATLLGTVMPSPFTPSAAQVDNGGGGPLSIGGGYSVILTATPLTYQATVYHQHAYVVAPIHGFASSQRISVTAKAENGNLPFAVVLLQNTTQYANLQLNGTPTGLLLQKAGGPAGAGGVFSNESIDPASGSIWFGSSSCTTPGGGSAGDLWAYNESAHDQGDVNSRVFCGQNPPEVRVPSAQLPDPGYARPQPPAATWPGVTVSSGTEFLCPGTYTDAILVSAGATAILLPGVFRVISNGVKVSGALRTMQPGDTPASGLTNGVCTVPSPLPSDVGAVIEIVPADDGTLTCKKHVFQTIGGTSSVSLVPSPLYNNISLYVETMSNWQTICKQGVGGTSVVQITGGGAYSVKGAIYAPADNVVISGGGAGTGVGQIIAWTANFNGNGTVTETYDPSGLPFVKGLIQ